MATTTASININSDIMSYPVSINKTMTMRKAGTCTGLTQSTGLSTRFYQATTQVVLHAYDTNTVTSGGANKVYIRNIGSDKAQYFIVTLADTTDAVEEVGRLYGGDWMLMPWEAASAHHNIYVQPSTADKMGIEYMIFYE